jgi:hypothetical protein
MILSKAKDLARAQGELGEVHPPLARGLAAWLQTPDQDSSLPPSREASGDKPLRTIIEVACPRVCK